MANNIQQGTSRRQFIKSAAARQLPGCETLVVAEAGHALQWEQPNVFNHAVISFLNKVTA